MTCAFVTEEKQGEGDTKLETEIGALQLHQKLQETANSLKSLWR